MAAYVSIVAWHVLFYPHSYVHAVFMVRTLVGLLFPAAMLIACLYGEALTRLLGRASTVFAR
jgi:hypothetical protein